MPEVRRVPGGHGGTVADGRGVYQAIPEGLWLAFDFGGVFQPPQVRAQPVSKSNTAPGFRRRELSNRSLIATRRAPLGKASAPSWIYATTGTGSNQSALLIQAITRSSGCGFQSSESTLLSSRQIISGAEIQRDQWR